MLKYRFKQGDGSNYPDWEKNKLLNVLVQSITDGPHETPKFIDNGIPFVSVESIENGKFNFSKIRGYISKEYDSYCAEKYKPQKYDVYMVKSGSTTGKVAINDTDIDFNIWSPLAAMRLKSKTEAYYLYYYLQTQYIQKQALKKRTNGTQPNLSMRKLETFEVFFPCPEEQQKIADFLSAVDNQIDIQRQRIEVIETQKKGLLDKVFSQELRFKQDDGSNYPDWEEKQLKDVSDCSTARKTDKLSSYVSTDNMIANFGGVIFDNDDEGTIRSVEYRNNDILLSNIRPYFKKLWLSDRNGVCSSDVKVFRPNNVNPAFLYYALSLDKFFSYIMKNVTGTKMPRGNVDFMKKYKFMVSKSLEEQQKIADFFTAIDNQIDIEKHRLIAMETIKKGLLQQMFC